jgi:hypothetical protein
MSNEKDTGKVADQGKAAETQNPAQAAPAPSKNDVAASISGLRSPDAEPVPGKDIAAGDLVRPNSANGMLDVLTLKAYPGGSWTEAVPSAWLDAQLKAGKIEVKKA